jgi:hypothetical protein
VKRIHNPCRLLHCVAVAAPNNRACSGCPQATTAGKSATFKSFRERRKLVIPSEILFRCDKVGPSAIALGCKRDVLAVLPQGHRLGRRGVFDVMELADEPSTRTLGNGHPTRMSPDRGNCRGSGLNDVHRGVGGDGCDRLKPIGTAYGT